MGVTTRGGARACVVGTGSTAARADVPPARGTRGVVRAEPGRRQSRERGGQPLAAEGAAANGAAAAPVRGRGAKRSAPAVSDALEGASTARRRAGEAVADVASLPVRARQLAQRAGHSLRRSRSALFFFPALSPPHRAARFPRRRATISALRTATDPALPSARDSQDDVLEVVFGHLARDASPAQYFDAMLT